MDANKNEIKDEETKVFKSNEGSKTDKDLNEYKSGQSLNDDYDRNKYNFSRKHDSKEIGGESNSDYDRSRTNRNNHLEEDDDHFTDRQEQHHYIPQESNQADAKLTPYKFESISSVVDSKEFDIVAKNRFSLTQRLLSSMYWCWSGNRTIQAMKQDLPEHPFDEDEDKFKKIDIKVLKSGPLAMNQYILHPFVKIHIVDLETWKYLAKKDPKEPGVFNRETSAYYNSFKVHFDCQNVEYYLPFWTSHYDLRPKAENFWSWYQKFTINVNAEYFLRPNVVLLFEILDFSSVLILEESSKLNSDNFLPIAWGFLRPIGSACRHLSDSKIQLYYYKESFSKKQHYKHEIDLRTPEVLCELNWPNKSKYPSFLEVNISFHESEKHKNITHFSRFPWEKEFGLIEFNHRDEKKKLIKFGKQHEKEPELEERLKYFKWERAKNEACKRPNRFLRKLETEELGAFRIRFSSSGEYLAAACTLNNSWTIIKIFKSTTGELIMKLKGHHDIIHELSWSQDDNLLISASGDGSVKIWNVAEKDEDIPDKLSYLENDRHFYICELIHPSYVYSAKFYKEDDKAANPYKIIATIWYDQAIRFWMCAINERGEYLYNKCIKSMHMLNIDNMKKVLIENKVDMDFLQNPTIVEHIYPNCLTFDRSGKMFIGDSIGLIRVWDVSYEDEEIYAENYFIIKQSEIEDDIINKIIVDPNDENRLIVHSRDSCIRIIEYNQTLKKNVKIRGRLFGASTQYQMILSWLSPDGTFLASGSESGNMFIWNVPTGELFFPGL